MAPLKNYIRVIKDYWKFPKGRHDIIDYARAIGLILMVTAVISLILAYFM